VARDLAAPRSAESGVFFLACVAGNFRVKCAAHFEIHGYSFSALCDERQLFDEYKIDCAELYDGSDNTYNQIAPSPTSPTCHSKTLLLFLETHKFDWLCKPETKVIFQ